MTTDRTDVTAFAGSSAVPADTRHPGAAARPYFFYMDAVRAFLMLLGVPYHAARLYGDGRDNAVHSSDTSRGLDIFAEISHSFRMEAFFIVAGFFACMVLMRSETRAFVRGRLIRIGMPLLVCTLVFAPFSAALIAAGRLGAPVTPDGVAVMLQAPGAWWVMHLWFLHTLLMLTLLLVAAVLIVGAWPPATRLAAALSAELSSLLRRPFLAAGAGIALAFVAIWIVPALARRLTGVTLDPFGYFFDLRPAIRFLPMFLFGAAMWVKPDVLAWMIRPQRAALPAALFGSAVFVIGSFNGRLEGVLTPVGACVAGLFWAQLLISGAARHFDRPSPLVRYIADASFTVYLFHFPIVLGLGLVFLRIGGHPLAEFAAITIITLALCFGIHEVIRRSGLLSLLFNGKPMGGRKARAPA